MNILFLTSTRIGDAVLSTGALAHLVARYPSARVTVACGPVAAPLFAAVPGGAPVIVVRKRRRGGHWWDLWRACAPRRWDIVVDLRASLFSYLLRAGKRFVMKPDRSRDHVVRIVGRMLGLDPPPAPHVWWNADHAAAAKALIADGGPVLALGPTANWLPKTWPADRFVGLAETLTAANGILPGARIAVFGGPDERGLAEPVLRGLPQDRLIDLVGGPDLLTVAAAIARCSLYVGNDSGLMHLAAAAGTPTLGLFGPSPPWRYAPWGPRAAAVTTDVPYEQLVAAPGFDHRAADCLMTSLSVDKAHAAAEALWQRVGGTA